jgi:hypothetical protein
MRCLSTSVALAVVTSWVRVDADPVRDYVVRGGETCLEISSRELGDAKRLAELHRLNPQLGASPHKLRAGQILRLPSKTGPADAHLQSPRGRVEVRRSGETSWGDGASGQALFRAWRVGTHERSSARVAFADASSIEMRDNTVVVIFGPRSHGEPLTRTTLERGTLRAKLALLDRPGTKRLAVSTPAGDAELTDGSAVVDVDARGETRLSNHAGSPAQLANARGKVVVPSGYGSRVVRAKPPARPTPLPPAPTWTTTSELSLAWKGTPGVVRGAWTPVKGAARYRIAIARSDAPDAIEARLELDAKVTSFEAVNLPAADYEVVVSTVDANGLEGIGSQARRVQIVELARPEPVVGEAFVPPSGLACTTRSDATPSLALVPDVDGNVTVRCVGARGGAMITLAVPVPAVASAAARVPQVEVDRRAIIDVALQHVRPQATTVTSRGALVVERIEQTTTGLRVHVQPKGPGPASLVVSLAGTAVVLGTIDVAVTTPPTPPVALRRDDHGLPVAITTFAGMTAARREDGNVVGAEVAVEATPWLAPHVAIAQVVGEVARYRLGLSWQPPFRARPLAQVGGSLEAGTLGVDLGLGLEIGAKRWRVRAIANLVVDERDTRVEVTGGLRIRVW